MGQLLHRLRRDRAEPVAQSLLAEGMERAERGRAVRDAAGKILRPAWEGGQAARGEIERHVTPLSDDPRGGYGSGPFSEQDRHFRLAFQVEFIVRTLSRAKIGQGDVMAGGREDVVQAVAIGRGVVDVVRGDDIHPHRGGRGQ